MGFLLSCTGYSIPGFSLLFFLFVKKSINLLHGHAIEYMLFPEPCFPGHLHTKPDITKSPETVGIRVKGNKNSLPGSPFHKTPVRIKAVGIAVMLKNNTMSFEGIKNCPFIIGIPFPG
jgi:hypothetical protein